MAGIGIIGTGWGARVQAPTFREAGLSVVAIAGHNRERTRVIADDLGLRPHDDWRDVIASSDVDLVSIVTPPSEHRAMAIAALEAGKHVLLEKPTAMNAREAEELVDAARRHPDRIALIDHELRFLPSWREARARIAEEIGEIRYAEVRYSSPARGDRSREWNWWSDASRGGGVWGAVGSHFVDALRYFGMEIEGVQAMMRTTIAQRPSGGDAMREVTSDDLTSVDLRLRGGAIAVMMFSAVAAGPDESSSLIVHGERGAMRFVGDEVALSKERAPFMTFAGGPMPERPGNSHGGAFGSGTLHLGHALRAAMDDGNREALAPAATFADGLMQQRVLDAARESATRGGWVAVERRRPAG
ncbi:MAG TPA: Gfo/Idh/MocA family oxidoreductase [Thermoanaerobaculia bacterium]|nr:Gfo/Idh/MocA family oxidoreductase [Thermoanaerobaculia bacterium]